MNLEVAQHRTEPLWMGKCECGWHGRAYSSERSAKVETVAHARLDHGLRWGDIDDWSAAGDEDLLAALATSSAADDPRVGGSGGGVAPGPGSLAGRALAAALLITVLLVGLIMAAGAHW